MTGRQHSRKEAIMVNLSLTQTAIPAAARPLDVALDYMHPAPAKALTGCPECDALLPKSHAHSDSLFRITSRTYPGCLHRTWIAGERASCTCEHGEVQKARKKDATCYHVGIARELQYRRRNPESPLRSSNYDLFGGDDIEPTTLESLFRG